MGDKIGYVIVALMVMIFIAIVFTALGIAELREAAGASVLFFGVPKSKGRAAFRKVNRGRA